MDPRDESWRLARKQGALRRRAMMVRAIRRFFDERDYLEVETPVRIPAPAPEAHIDAAPSGDWFLQTSPELCMKRLVAAGYPGIYQISKCFRAAERGRLHLPEFTMLEWYCRGGDCRTLMQECEALVLSVAQALDRGDALTYQGMTIALTPPWERLSVTDAFARYASLSLRDALAQDRFDEIMACEIEHRFADGRPVFLYDYPAAHGALARTKAADPSLVERFELYFEQALRVRHAAGKAAYPMPEPFLRSLQDLPETAGIALGVDRLAMLFADAVSIDEVVSFIPEAL